jgi:FtsZ-binding cell division protein ZapB
MTDRKNLKSLCEAAPTGPWLVENDSLYFKDDGYTRHLLDADAGHDVEEEAYYAALRFIAAANPAAVLALIAESQAMAGLLKRFVDGEYEQDENQAERHMYFTEAQSLLALMSGELEAHTIVPDSAIKAIHAERDQLKAEIAGLRTGYEAYERVNAELKAKNEAMRKDRTHWQAECLKRGFEYVRESDDHYVLADVPEMADLLGSMLGVEVRSKENDAYEEANSQLNEQIEGLINTIHAQESMRKDAERLQIATALVQKLCDAAGNQPSVATGYLHDILAALGQGEQS